MELAALLAPLIFIVVCLLVGAVFKTILKHISIPYTVALFCFGMGMGLLNRHDMLTWSSALSDSLTRVGDMDPNLILYLFLPILVFDASYELNAHIFKKTLVNASLLAIPGVIIAMALTAAMMIGIGMIAPDYAQWSWTHALMFGALISATDPVAVVALLKELGVSKRFSTLVDAESLLNDGTGIVLFMLFFSTFTAGAAEQSSPLVNFLVVVFGGLLVGFVIARFVIFFLDHVKSETVVQNSLIIVTAYATFILSEGYLELSGVIALVAFGLTIGYSGKPILKENVNVFMEEFWELLSYIANTLIFIIVGVVIAMNVDFAWSDMAVLCGVYVGLLLIRMVVIYVLYPLMKRNGYGLSLRESVILGWGGLRGAVGLILALMVSCTTGIEEPVREQILFITAGIVTLTLTINASTSRWFLNMLGLTKVSNAQRLVEYGFKKDVENYNEKYLEKLQSRDVLHDANWDVVKSFIPDAGPEPVKDVADPDLLATVRIKVLDRNKQLTRQLYNEGSISEHTFRALTESFNEQYDYEGKHRLSDRKNIFDYFERHPIMLWLRSIPSMREYVNKWSHGWVIESFDLARGFLLLQKEALQTISELRGTNLYSDEEKAAMEELVMEVQQNIDRIGPILEELAREYPRSFKCAVTHKAVRMLLCNEQRHIKRNVDDGVLSAKDAEMLQDSLDERKELLSTHQFIKDIREREFANAHSEE